MPQFDSDTTTAPRSGAGNRSDEKNKAVDAYETARTKAGSAYESARQQANSAYDSAARAGRRATNELSSNPLAAILGGLALGAVIAALLPKTRREVEVLGDWGQKLTETAKDSAKSAIEAGKEQVNELTENAANKVGHAVIDAVAGATRS
jgi:ElaB/YqjD/DUF883 family membrane-anchored ribosome-binding protein